MVVPQVPAAALPAVIGRRSRQRQHLADDFIQALAEDFAQAFALELVLQARIFGGDVLRQGAFAPQVIEIVFVGREYKLRRQFQALGDAGQKTPGHYAVGAIALLLIGDQCAVVPDRHAVAAPVAVEGPARQLLAGVPLALAEMHQALGRVVLAHALEQLGRQSAFVRAESGGVPFRTVRVVDGDKGRLAAHGQAHVVLEQVTVDLPAQGLDRQPLLFGVGLGNPWGLPNPLHGHLVGKFALAGFHQATDGRC